MLRVAVDGDVPRLYPIARPLAPALRAGLAGPGPVVILIHGYKFAPGVVGHDPHQQIFSTAPERGGTTDSWPRQLGFGEAAGSGLCIAFGWPARGWFRDVYARAAGASRALAQLVRAIRDFDAHRPIHVVAHSLGARVCLGALTALRPHDLGRIILLSGAEYCAPARAAMATPAGRTAEIFNITSRENDLYELMFESVIGPHRWGDRGIGVGLGEEFGNWVDVQIDHVDVRRVLSRYGAALPGPRRRMCHWSTYQRRGAMAFYSDLLRRPGAIPLDALRRALPPQERRFRQVLRPPRIPRPLPLGQKRPS
ncbi:MAG: alpha/beta hydrolase [Pseudomonadota bacterium]